MTEDFLTRRQRQLTDEGLQGVFLDLVRRRREHLHSERNVLDVPQGHVVHHLDGNPHNNALDNLRLIKLEKNP